MIPINRRLNISLRLPGRDDGPPGERINISCCSARTGETDLRTVIVSDIFDSDISASLHLGEFEESTFI